MSAGKAIESSHFSDIESRHHGDGRVGRITACAEDGHARGRREGLRASHHAFGA